MNPTAIAAVNSGVAALRRAVKPAGSVTVAMAMSVNGTAENSAPTMRKVVIRPRATRRVAGPPNTSRTAAPIASRISAAQAGPTSGAAIRRNRNAAPQTAPRKSSEAKSTMERERRVAGTGVGIPGSSTAEASIAIAPGPSSTSSFDDVESHRCAVVLRHPPP